MLYNFYTEIYWYDYQNIRKMSPGCHVGALNCGKRVVPEETVWVLRDSIAERKFITEVSLVLLLLLCVVLSKIPGRPIRKSTSHMSFILDILQHLNI